MSTNEEIFEGFAFKKSEKIIEISRPEVSVFQIYDAGRTWQGELNNMDTLVVSATGTEKLPDGAKTPITLTLEEGWKIRAAPNRTVIINRGNIRSKSEENPFIHIKNANIVYHQSTKNFRVEQIKENPYNFILGLIFFFMAIVLSLWANVLALLFQIIVGIYGVALMPINQKTEIF